MTQEQIDRLQRVRTAPFGCLKEGCPTVLPTYAEIAEHMDTAHPGEFPA